MATENGTQKNAQMQLAQRPHMLTKRPELEELHPTRCIEVWHAPEPVKQPDRQLEQEGVVVGGAPG